MQTKYSLRAIGTAAVFLGAFACAKQSQSGWETTTDSAQKTKAPVEAETKEKANMAWKECSDLSKLNEAIGYYEMMLNADPSDGETWTRLSRAHYFKADCHLRFKKDESEKAHERFLSEYEAGKVAAERALGAISEPLRDHMKAGGKLEEMLPSLDKRAVGPLYWRSSNLGKWASATDIATLLSYKDEIKATMSRCLELDKEYFYYGPNRYFGVYFSRAPSFAGRDLKASKQHFETSIAKWPQYLGTHVLFADEYAVVAQDKDLYTKELDYVLSADPNAIPDIAPENRCEQRKAAMLKEQTEERFE